MAGYAVNVGVNLKVTSASVAPVINSMQKQLQGKPIHIPVTLDFKKFNVQDINRYNTNFKAFSNTLKMLSVNALHSAQSINKLGMSLHTLQRSMTGIGGGASGIAQLPKQANAAAQNMTRLGQVLRTNNTHIATFAENIAVTTKRFAAFMVGATALYSVTSGLYAAAKAALEFDREMVRFKQVSGDSAEIVRGIEKEIGRLSVGLGTSSQDLAKAAVTLRQAGLSARETKTALDALAKTTLSASFDDLQSTTEGVIAIMAQFKGGAGALEQQLGALSKVSADYAVESRDLVEAVKRTGGAFAAAGGNLNELMALFTSIRATTRESAESIATGMRTILGRLEDPKIAQKLRENFNIQLYDKGQFIGYYNAIKKISEVVRALPAGNVKIAEIVRDIGGLRNLSRVIPLLTEFPLAEQVKKSAEKGEGKLTKDAMIAQQALLTQITRVKEGFLDLFRTLAQDKSVTYVLGGIANFLTGISQALKTIQPLVPVLLALATVGTVRYVGRNIGNITSGFRTGRYGANLPGAASGGIIRGYAAGNVVEGPAGRDRVLARLTRGEYVIKEPSVRKLAENQISLDELNQNPEGFIRRQKLLRRYSPEALFEAEKLQREHTRRMITSFGNQQLTSGSMEGFLRSQVGSTKSSLKYLLREGRLEKLGLPHGRGSVTFGYMDIIKRYKSNSGIRGRIPGFASGGLVDSNDPYNKNVKRYLGGEGFDSGLLFHTEKGHSYRQEAAARLRSIRGQKKYFELQQQLTGPNPGTPLEEIGSVNDLAREQLSRKARDFLSPGPALTRQGTSAKALLHHRLQQFQNRPEPPIPLEQNVTGAVRHGYDYGNASTYPLADQNIGGNFYQQQPTVSLQRALRPRVPFADKARIQGAYNEAADIYAPGELAKEHFGIQSRMYGGQPVETPLSKFSYTAKTREGRDITGSIRASTEGYARTLVESQGNFVTSIKKLDQQKGVVKNFFAGMSETYRRADKEVQRMTGGKAFKGMGPGSFKLAGAAALSVGAIAAPLLAENLLGTAREPGRYGKSGAKIGAVLGGAITSGGIGAAVGSQFGPIGTGIGALGGAIVGAIGALKEFDDELGRIRLEEFEKNISRINFNERGEFKTAGDIRQYQKSIVQALPDIEEIRTKRDKAEDRYTRGGLSFFEDKNLVEATKPNKAALFQYANEETKQRLSDYGLGIFKQMSQANPEMSREDIMKKAPKVQTQFGELNLDELIRLNAENVDASINWHKGIMESAATQKKLVGIQQEAVVAYEQINQLLEEYGQNLENAGKQFNVRSTYSQMGSNALQGRLTASPTNLTTANLPGFEGLTNFAKTGGQYDQAKKLIAASIGEHGRNIKGGPENSMAAAENVVRDLQGKDFGVPTEAIMKNLKYVLGNTADLGKVVEGGGATQLAEQALAPVKGFKEAKKATDEQLNATYQQHQQEKINQLDRKYEMDQRNAALAQQNAGFAGQQASAMAELGTSRYQTTGVGRTTGGINPRFNYNRISQRLVSPEEQAMRAENQANIAGFEASRTALTGLVGASPQEVAKRIQVEQENVRAKSAEQQAAVAKGAPVEEVNKLGDAIKESEDKIRRYNEDLKNLSQSTVRLEAAQKEFATASKNYQADLGARKKIAGTMTFGSRAEQAKFMMRENLTQSVLQNYSAEQFRGLPDAIRKMVGEHLQDTAGLSRSVEKFDQYGRSRGYTNYTSEQATDYLQQPALRMTKGLAARELEQNVNRTNRGVQGAIDQRKEAAGLLNKGEMTNLAKTSKEISDNFSTYVRTLNESIQKQMEATQVFLNNSSELVTALKEFPKSIELTRNGQVEVIINGGQALMALKGDLEKYVWEKVKVEMEKVAQKVNDKQPVR